MRSVALLALLAAGCHLLIDPGSVPPPPPSELIYTDASYPIGVAIEPITPPWTHGVPIDTFAIEPALPLGLSLDGDGGVTGTPIAIARPVLYQVTAANGAGAATGFVELSVNAGEITSLSSLAAGGDHTCVATNGERVLCWGGNPQGQLGDGTDDPARFPVMSLGVGPGIQAIASSDSHVCAIAGGAASCWGAGYDGTGTGNWDPAPRAAPGGESGIQAIAAGRNHTCMVAGSGVQCWGENGRGQLGDGTPQSRPAPVGVLGLSAGTSVAAGSWHSCAIAGGGVQCWGDNTCGQVGDSLDAGVHARPFPVTRLPAGAQTITAGEQHTCAIVDGGAYCWGYNYYGQLGIDTVIDTAQPTAVKRLGQGVTAIAAGANHTCAIAAGVAYCWGRNDRGQLGSAASSFEVSPKPVPGLPTGIQAIAAGAAHSCAIVASEVWCWGDNRASQMGNGSPDASSGLATVYFGGP